MFERRMGEIQPREEKEEETLVCVYVCVCVEGGGEGGVREKKGSYVGSVCCVGCCYMLASRLALPLAFCFELMTSFFPCQLSDLLA